MGASESVTSVGHNGVTVPPGRRRIAQQFTTGMAETDYNLRSAVFIFTAPTGDPEDLTVDIHESDSDNVGRFRGRLSTETVVFDRVGTYRLDAPAGGGILLAPDTAYWLVLDAPNAPNPTEGMDFYQIAVGTTSSDDGDPGWSIDGRHFRSIRGAAFTEESSTLSFALIADVVPSVPPAPTGVSAMAGDGSITVSWMAGTGVTGQPASEAHDICVILASTTNFPSNRGECVEDDSVNVPATNATITGLTNGTAYKIAVRSFESNMGALSDWVEASGTHTPTDAALRLKLRVFLESALP